MVAFAHPRLYHRVAVAAEDAGFIIYPHLIWDYGNSGIPQPQNVSTLFDRDSGLERKIVGYQRRSGYATALVTHGVQNYNSMMVPVYEKCVSEEAKVWEGYYYGLKTFKPCFETILLAQKPVARKKMVENIREFGTGPLYMGCGESWPKPVFHHPKAKKSEHQSDHPTVKPVSLMEELCRLACPMASGRHILDPFAGTGTTGVAAKNLGLSSTLIEMNGDLEAVIRRRVGHSAPE